MGCNSKFKPRKPHKKHSPFKDGICHKQASELAGGKMNYLQLRHLCTQARKCEIDFKGNLDKTLSYEENKLEFKKACKYGDMPTGEEELYETYKEGV